MQRTKSLVLAAVMLGVGYGWGASGISNRGTVRAQDAKTGTSDEVVNKIREAYRRLNEARETLAKDGKYESITGGVNAFLVLSGGGNARQDLESGRGVDPETFAALYAGHALPEIQALLGTDESGRITYQNEVVRMYSKTGLEQAYANRVRLTELGL